MEILIAALLGGLWIIALVLMAKVFQLSRNAGDSTQKQALTALKTQLDSTRDLCNQLVARQDMLVTSVESALNKLAAQLGDSTGHNEQKLENLRRTLSEGMTSLQDANTRQLDSIRKTVDDKLQETLDKKLSDSFRTVSERLEQVYKGLGEMHSLAAGVGDLKKVLSNVKTRGALGEIQLGAILELMLSPEQYGKDVHVTANSRNVVEYAVKLPGEGGRPVWLPIDSKFPVDAYAQLVDAYDTADGAAVEVASKLLRARVREFAKDIRSKYITPPDTTDFAIMFLPTEGLYAELVRMGMVEVLQGEFRVNIAGPTTLGALLNSLQMGFRTLAIQQRSSEVWGILGKVKAEFDTFARVLESTRTRLRQADEDLEKLVGTRTNQIRRALRAVETLPEGEEQTLLSLPEDSDV